MNEEFIKAWSKFLQSIKVEDDCTDKKKKRDTVFEKFVVKFRARFLQEEWSKIERYD